MPYSEKNRDEIKEMLSEVGDRFHIMRLALGMTQQEIGDMVGMTQTNVGHIERGNIFPPPLLQRALHIEKGVSLHWLFYDEGEMIERKPENPPY